MLKEKYPYYLANEAVFANTDLEVTDKYSGEVATRVAMADAKTIDEAIAWSVKAEKAMAALHRVGVADYAAQRANTLSGGQQQRGAIARAIVQGAQAILADEPVASLDPVSARKVMELLVELNRRDGLGVIVTLHQVDYAIRYCERVIALKAGKVVYDGPSAGLDRPTLIDIYGPEFEDAFWETQA